LTADERDGATRNFANAWDANRQISEDGQLFDFMDLGLMCLPQTTTQLDCEFARIFHPEQ